MKSSIPLRLAAVLTLATGITLSAHARTSPVFVSNNNDSDILGVANYTDETMVNPWGLTTGTEGNLHVCNNGPGIASVYGKEGQIYKSGTAGVLILPAVSGTGTPTGVDENLFAILTGTENDFPITSGSITVSSHYIYCTEDGAIEGSNEGAGSTVAIIGTTVPDAGYTGIALTWSGSGAATSGTTGTLKHRLYAANFAQGRVDVFDDQFNLLTLTGSAPFAATPPPVTSGTDTSWSPFNIHRLDFQVKGKTYRYLMVAYALHTAAAPLNDVPGAGNGYIDVYTPEGVFVSRLVPPGANLDSPWGMAVSHSPKHLGLDAPVAVLVGNHGDGAINAYAVVPGFFNLTEHLGTVMDDHGAPLAFANLWALHFGAIQVPKLKPFLEDPADIGEDPAQLYFSAGIVEELRGLSGSISLK